MADAITTSHWCYMCRQRVIPIMEPELKCPFCDNGFVEEIAGREVTESEEVGSEQAISSWASVMMGMMGNPPRRPRSWRFPRIEDDDDSDLERELDSILRRRQRETDEDVWRTMMDVGDEEPVAEHELDSILQSRRQGSAIRQLLRSLREDFRSETDEPEMERGRERERERENESLVLLNSFNEAVILEGSLDSDQNQSHESGSAAVGASIGDYFVGPGLEMLLQHLAENDPNCYGTPPAQKEAIDSLPTVKIQENLNCSVCLEILEVGIQAKEMPCYHKFHKDCILPWLELHSSCPVCRFQLPADVSKTATGSTIENRGGVSSNLSIRGRRNGSRASSSWPFSGSF